VFYCHRGRHPVLMRMRTGVTKEGRIVGHSIETLLDGGAYGSYGVASTFYTGALETVTYQIDRYQFRGCRTSPTSRRAAPSAATAPCSRGSASRSRSTSSASGSRSTRRQWRIDHAGGAGQPDRELAQGPHESAWCHA